MRNQKFAAIFLVLAFAGPSTAAALSCSAIDWKGRVFSWVAKRLMQADLAKIEKRIQELEGERQPIQLEIHRLRTYLEGKHAVQARTRYELAGLDKVFETQPDRWLQSPAHAHFRLGLLRGDLANSDLEFKIFEIRRDILRENLGLSSTPYSSRVEQFSWLHTQISSIEMELKGLKYKYRAKELKKDLKKYRSFALRDYFVEVRDVDASRLLKQWLAKEELVLPAAIAEYQESVSPTGPQKYSVTADAFSKIREALFRRAVLLETIARASENETGAREEAKELLARWQDVRALARAFPNPFPDPMLFLPD